MRGLRGIFLLYFFSNSEKNSRMFYFFFFCRHAAPSCTVNKQQWRSVADLVLSESMVWNSFSSSSSFSVPSEKKAWNSSRDNFPSSAGRHGHRERVKRINVTSPELCYNLTHLTPEPWCPLISLVFTRQFCFAISQKPSSCLLKSLSHLCFQSRVFRNDAYLPLEAALTATSL